MRRLVVIAFATALAGCHRYPEPTSLASYHGRDIDRPYTLPSDVNTWVTLAGGGYLGAEEPELAGDSPDQPMAEPTDGEWVAPIPIPFGYEISLGSSVTLEAFMVPLGVRAQLAHSEQRTWGVRFGPSTLLFSSVDGFVGGVDAVVYYRRRLGRDVALETTVGSGYTYRESTSDSVGASLTTGPLVQLSDSLSVRPFATVGGSSRDSERSAIASFGSDAGLRIARRWRLDLSATSRLDALGHDRNSFLGTGSLTYFW